MIHLSLSIRRAAIAWGRWVFCVRRMQLQYHISLKATLQWGSGPALSPKKTVVFNSVLRTLCNTWEMRSLSADLELSLSSLSTMLELCLCVCVCMLILTLVLCVNVFTILGPLFMLKNAFSVILSLECCYWSNNRGAHDCVLYWHLMMIAESPNM